MAWYIAKSLETLRHQLNTIAPNRSTKSDGGIGDAAHSARLSDHNPTSSGQVCAPHLTNDPAARRAMEARGGRRGRRAPPGRPPPPPPPLAGGGGPPRLHQRPGWRVRRA